MGTTRDRVDLLDMGWGGAEMDTAMALAANCGCCRAGVRLLVAMSRERRRAHPYPSSGLQSTARLDCSSCGHRLQLWSSASTASRIYELLMVHFGSDYHALVRWLHERQSLRPLVDA